MENFGWITLVTFIAGVVGTGLGGFVGALFKKDSNRVVSLLLSFAGGVMLAIVAFDLIPSALKPNDTIEIEWYLVVLFILLGFGVVYFLNTVIDKKLAKQVPHTSKEHSEAHDNLDEMIHSDHYQEHKKSGSNLFLAGLVMAVVIALHNLPEGMVIGATYAFDDSIIGSTGFVIALTIGLHNIPEGMAISVPLISGGTKKWKAVLAAALSGLPTVIGAMLAFLIGSSDPFALALCLSLASGAMLYVVFGELLPESILMWKSKLPALFVLLGVLVGFAIIFGTAAII